MPIYFGDKIRKARKAAGMTQRQLADKINVSNTSISNWEKNLSRPDPDTIQHLCWALNVQPNYFFEVETSKLPDNILPLPRMKEWRVLGGTACGEPLYKELDGETIWAPADIDADCVFRCVGDSMIGARILDGDIVFVKSGEFVDNGQIAVVRIGEEYTLKRIYRGPDYLELRSENPKYLPIIVQGDQINAEIVGKAVRFLSRIV